MSSILRGSDVGEAISPRRDRLSSLSLEDSFLPFSSTSTKRTSLLTPLSMHGFETISESDRGRDPSSPAHEDSNALLLEKDLTLAAEVGRALLERNEELSAQLEQKDRELEALQQEKHMLKRQLEVLELDNSQREAELQADISSLREQLERQLSQGKDRRREETEQLAQLSNHNQRLVEQLAEAVSVEHSLRSELRTLREEMEDGSLTRSISTARLDSLQAENRILQEHKASIEEQLRSIQADNDRLCSERDALRERVTALQASVIEREAELDQERSSAFQLRTLNHSLQQKVQALGEEVSLGGATFFPMSLHCEIQQSQAKEAMLFHSESLQEHENEIQKLKNELQSKDRELQSMKEELQTHRQPPEKPSYSALEAELATVRKERESLNQQLINTIKHKVMLSQEVDAWQDDMRYVIRQQVKQQEEERQRDRKGLSRDSRTSKSLRLRGEGGKKEKGGFFSSFFSSD